MDLRKMMKQAQQLQQQLQSEIDQLEVASSVGGGMVEVRMSGAKVLLAVKIDPEALDPSDPEMLQDLVLSAVNDAGRKVDEEIKKRVGGMGLPGL